MKKFICCLFTVVMMFVITYRQPDPACICTEKTHEIFANSVSYTMTGVWIKNIISIDSRRAQDGEKFPEIFIPYYSVVMVREFGN